MRSSRLMSGAALVAVAVAGLTAITVWGATGDVGGDDIPGAPLPGSPFSGSLTTTTYPYQLDVDDVFGVTMRRNDRIDVTLTVPPDADFDVYFIAPGARSVVAALQPPYSRLLAYSGKRVLGATETFTYVSNRSVAATHFVDVKQWEGSGLYELAWRLTKLPAPAIEATLPKTASYLQATSLVATATGAGGSPLSGLRGQVLAKPHGEVEWAVVSTSTSTPEGRLSFVVRPAVTTRYRVRTTWARGSDGLDVGYGYSSIMTVTPYAHLTIAAAPDRVARSARFTVSGHLKPAHGTGRGHVRVGAWRRTASGGWAFYRSFAASGSGTRYSARVALPRTGRWRIKAVVAADDMHLKSYSAYRYLRVY